MILVPLYAPCVLGLSEDCDRAVIQYGGPDNVCTLEGTAGWFVRQQLYQMTHERLIGFQHGPFACDANADAITCLRAARHHSKVRMLAAPDPEGSLLPRAIDGEDPTNGAAHLYLLPHRGEGAQRVQYQHGPRGFPDSVPGVFDDAILAILQETAEHSRERRYLRAARNALAMRAARRLERGILGTNRP